jgi:alkylated DNA repair dioxygenase AlkB
LGRVHEAEAAARGDNATVNQYETKWELAMHNDPACYEPCLVALCLGAERAMTFKAPDGRSELVFLDHGDLYVLKGAGYTHWKHGMTRQAKAPAASVTMRKWKATRRPTGTF